MHLAMRCLDNMLRSDSSGGMSASSKLLATAKVGRALSLRWLWQVWQIRSLLSSGISAVIITNMYILSRQACCNRIWIFYVIWPYEGSYLVWKWCLMTHSAHISGTGLYLWSEHTYGLFDQRVVILSVTLMSLPIYSSVFPSYFHCTSYLMHTPKCKFVFLLVSHLLSH